jgi:uncharacterized membrane protein
MLEVVADRPRSSRPSAFRRPRINRCRDRGSSQRAAERRTGRAMLDALTAEATMSTPVESTREPAASLINIAHLVYALHTLGLVIGAFGAASVVGSFLFGWPSIIAVIINYVKRSEVRGTWLDSHFSWQIRTFWWALLWAIIIGVIGVTLTIVLIGIPILIFGFLALGIWAIYRIARGWLRLKDRKPMPT